MANNKNNWDIKTMSKAEIITIRVLLWVLGIVLLIFGLVYNIFLLFGVVPFYFAYLCKKELKRRKNESKQAAEPNTVKVENNTGSSPNPPQTVEHETPYIFLRFKVAGVTFKNGRKTRQAILRAFKWGDETPETVDFELYEYEGRPAVYVKINDQVVGNIPSDTTEKFLEYEKLYKRDNIHCDIYGGSKLDDGSRTNYGCEIIIRYLREKERGY